jgi:hypothetical protein
MDRVSTVILMSIIALAIHLVEEIKTGFRQRFPLGEMPRAVFVGFNILIYTFGFTTFFLSLSDAVLALPLTWIWAIAMLLNGIGHVGAMLFIRQYFPGGMTAPVLTLVAGHLIFVLV